LPQKTPESASPSRALALAACALALGAPLLSGWAGMAAGAGAAGCVLYGRWKWAKLVRQGKAQRDALRDRLLQSQKLAAIGEVAAGIAHEINNPLAVITQETEWMEHLLAPPLPMSEQTYSAVRQGLKDVQAQVNRCADITHSLLSLARNWTPILQPVDLNTLAEDMAKLVELEARQRNVTLDRRYAPDLPEALLDPPLMRQAILNLLVNALHAVEGGGVISMATAPGPEGGCILRVADTGPGIPEQNISRIFDPFFTTKAPGKGTGLGLAITHRIIDRLGGTITAESPPGKGAVFTISLPPTPAKEPQP